MKTENTEIKIPVQRTIREWFKILPFIQRRRALKNLEDFILRKNIRDDYGGLKYSHLSGALLAGFEFKNTPEGKEYWELILAKHLKNIN